MAAWIVGAKCAPAWRAVRARLHRHGGAAMSAIAGNPTDANKALGLEGIKGVFIDRDPTVLDRLFSDDYRQHNPQIPNGTAAIKALLGRLPADFKYEPGLVVAEGDYVTIHGRYWGWGPKPMVAVDIFRVADGKIAEHWDVMQE